jgi:hypothetical protein
VERTAKPIFPIIIETSSASYDQWTIIHDVDSAVDDLMVGTAFPVERRSRNPVTGEVHSSTVQYQLH